MSYSLALRLLRGSGGRGVFNSSQFCKIKRRIQLREVAELATFCIRPDNASACFQNRATCSYEHDPTPLHLNNTSFIRKVKFSTTDPSKCSPPSESKSGKYKEQRLAALGNVSYPHKFAPTLDIPTFLTRYQGVTASEPGLTEERLGGMVVGVREAGKRLRFIDLEGQGGLLQLKVDCRSCNGDGSLLRRGDRVGATGKAVRTKAGELSLATTCVDLLAPCLRNIPSQGFQSSSKRLQRRYLDLMTSKEARHVLVMRSRIISHFRKFLQAREFLEVETPVLSSSVGGASARPFICHHHALDSDLFLRVAPELFLKQLVIGGLDRVFEIGKQFRNEGVDHSHNPEFTSCEFYQAWADYEDLAAMTQELLGSLVTELKLEPTHQGIRLDFLSDYQRLEYIPTLEAALGVTLAPVEDLEAEGSIQQLQQLCRRENLDPDGSAVRLLDRLSGSKVEPGLVQPTLLFHHPTIMSPLAKQHREKAGIAERFELFVAGQEVCNAYTELNDPEAQRKAFASQADSSDPEAMLPDEAFCTALEYGLPPTAGWGCGMDRLTAILTGQSHIRDTVAFPLAGKPTDPR